MSQSCLRRIAAAARCHPSPAFTCKCPLKLKKEQIIFVAALLERRAMNGSGHRPPLDGDSYL